MIQEEDLHHMPIERTAEFGIHDNLGDTGTLRWS